MTLLGVNIDHIATVRQARRGSVPSPAKAALVAVKNGADGITAHLREDRRHIQDSDIRELKNALSFPLNLEMSASEDILKVAESVLPAWACLVPEKRQELTTEGGLDVRQNSEKLKAAVKRLKTSGIKVSLFVEADADAIKAAADMGADAVELHTGVYARACQAGRADAAREIERLVAAARKADSAGLKVNAGHGLDYDNVADLARAFPFHEFNIGFSIIARAVFMGIGPAVREMKERMASVCAES